MQVNLIMQKSNDNTLVDKWKICFAKKPKKAYFFFGNLKESGFKILEEELIDTTTEYYFVIGIDKKNTTRIMLDSMLKYSDEVYYYSNNGLNEFTTNICIFEYTDEVYMYVGSSNISESGLIDDVSVYSEIIFDLNIKEDKSSYKTQLKNLIKKLNSDGFTKLDKSGIDKLVEEKEIFTTRQYNHNVMSISELLNTTPKENKKSVSKEEIDDVYVQDTEIPKVDLSDISLDIDLSDLENTVQDNSSEDKEDEIEVTYDEDEFNNMSNLDEVKKLLDSTLEKLEDEEENDNENQDEEIVLDVNNEFYDASMADDVIDTDKTIDINDLLFSKADVKLDIGDIKRDKKVAKNTKAEEEKVQVKKVNLNNISNFIFELPNRPLKEQDQNILKIPNYIRTMIPDFFGLNEKIKTVEINGAVYKIRNIKIEVIDVGTDTKYTDREAKIMYKTGQTYFVVSSEIFKNIIYSEKDIVRMIKLAGDIYHIEFIPKEMQEYKLWSKICTQSFKSTTRKYGMM